jgi:hypothetical protein
LKLDAWGTHVSVDLEDPATRIRLTLAQLDETELATLVARLGSDGARIIVATNRGLWDFTFPDTRSPSGTASLMPWSDVRGLCLSAEIEKGNVDQASGAINKWKLRLSRPEFEIVHSGGVEPLGVFLDLWREHVARS